MTDSSSPLHDKHAVDWHLRAEPIAADVKRLRVSVDELRRQVRRLYVLCVVLSAALALGGVLLVRDSERDDRQRAVRFCLLVQQSVDTATPQEPVSPLLLASADAVGCALRFPAPAPR